MENTVIFGEITATSVKQNGEFDGKNSTKTGYVKVDDANAEKLKAFGLQEYGKDDKFFIIKFSGKTKGYAQNETIDLSEEVGLDTPNFKVAPTQLNIIQGENKGNTFYRINAIQLVKGDELELIEASNPFETSADALPF